MKTGLKVVIGFFAILPLIVASCMMKNEDDIPDFNEQLQRDIVAIDSYLASNGIMAAQDVSGIRYVIHRDSTETNRPTVDSCVTADYSGKLLVNGYEFDKGTGISFPLRKVIDGWKIGIPLLNEGDSATLYIPSGYAYGYVGIPPEIPKNANLIFHVALRKVGSTYKEGSNTTPGSCN